MLVVPDHLSQVVNICIVVLRSQIVLLTIYIPTAVYAGSESIHEDLPSVLSLMLAPEHCH